MVLPKVMTLFKAMFLHAGGDAQAWQPYADFLVSSVLMALPWGGSELAESAPDQITLLFSAAESYINTRPHKQQLGLRPFLHATEDPDLPAQSDSGGASFLAVVSCLTPAAPPASLHLPDCFSGASHATIMSGIQCFREQLCRGRADMRRPGNMSCSREWQSCRADWILSTACFARACCGHADMRSQVWEAVSELRGKKNWRNAAISRPTWLQFEARLAEGQPHELPPLTIPPTPPGTPANASPTEVPAQPAAWPACL